MDLFQHLSILDEMILCIMCLSLKYIFFQQLLQACSSRRILADAAGSSGRWIKCALTSRYWLLRVLAAITASSAPAGTDSSSVAASASSSLHSLECARSSMLTVD